MDADGQHQFSDILKLFEKVEKEDLDLVVGKRQNFSSGIFRELGKKIILTVSKFLLTVKISDLNSGMKLYKTETLLKYLDLCPNGMSFSDIIVLIFIYYNNRIDEVDIIVKKRIGGKSTISFKTAYETIVEIFNIIMLFNPFKIFSLISLFLLILSFIWGIPILLAGKGISVGTGLLILTSVQFFLLGLISEQVSKIRKDIILLKNIIKKN